MTHFFAFVTIIASIAAASALLEVMPPSTEIPLQPITVTSAILDDKSSALHCQPAHFFCTDPTAFNHNLSALMPRTSSCTRIVGDNGHWYF